MSRMLLVLLASCCLLGMMGLSGKEQAPSAIDPSEQRIELTIRDSIYIPTKVTPIQAGFPVTISIRNDDDKRHGFTSPMLKGLLVKGEADDVEFYGRGIDGVHIGPGKTALIQVIVPQQGALKFQCDLHSEMQGELYLLDVPVG